MTIHRRATPYEHGPIPEGLLNLARLTAGRSRSFNALARHGSRGYKHVGLELEVTDESHTAEDIAGAVMQMVTDYCMSTGVDLFRVDAYDGNGDLLESVVLRIGEGGADEIEAAGGGAGRWAVKALKDTHDRYLGCLDRLDKLAETVAQALEAMAGAIGAASEVRWQFASAEAEREAQSHQHERQMEMLRQLGAYITANKTHAGGSSPLLGLLTTMPADVKDSLRSILGELFDDLAAAARVEDREQRKAQLAAVLERITPAMKARLGMEIQGEWASQIMAALRAELA